MYLEIGECFIDTLFKSFKIDYIYSCFFRNIGSTPDHLSCTDTAVPVEHVLNPVLG